ncbi:glycosyltransferase family 2 protein [Ancylomarina salipaludis]|uniref:Glycosyltransferase family 2 protein n=1 Tax=Ancylomarina salipaludis TaxID=2501299 RepID=A0A4Q1JLL0_9BACT|nr:glycosyltransferase family 2 protein [Ancylomarina salipaludis]RXQ94472.1 glycosyltransferase family 2 protein [Ancylomarina salipaludis]
MNRKNYKFGEKLPISATIICYNEESNIEETLKSLDFIDEIIVIDSYSTDKTIEIVSRYTDKIYYNKFKDFSDQRNIALSKVSNNWVMRIDSDEIITPSLKQKIYDILNQDDCSRQIVYKTALKNMFMGRLIKHSNWGGKPVHFLYNFNHFKYKNAVHELPDITETQEIVLKNVYLIHNTYKGVTVMFRKTDQYSTIKAKQLFDKQVKITPFHLAIKPTYRFIFHYLLNLGFLDGRQGFIIAKMKALEVYWRYLKCWRLQKGETID